MCPHPIPNPSHQHICWPVALTEVTDLIFEAFFTHFDLCCTLPLAIEYDRGDGLKQNFAKSKATQLGPDHIAHPLCRFRQRCLTHTITRRLYPVVYPPVSTDRCLRQRSPPQTPYHPDRGAGQSLPPLEDSMRTQAQRKRAG